MQAKHGVGVAAELIADLERIYPVQEGRGQ